MFLNLRNNTSTFAQVSPIYLERHDQYTAHMCVVEPECQEAAQIIEQEMNFANEYLKSKEARRKHAIIYTKQGVYIIGQLILRLTKIRLLNLSLTGFTL
ncbi:hypothetical protein GJ496_000050 [Pomphorhynchus laevis]|nr:hypothetical protein GJ496_004163 [Pomphorhynchus laevis]KAI0987024.1 hypothetical protein GJ496_000050 [Pomphorhynchus laevis]